MGFKTTLETLSQDSLTHRADARERPTPYACVLSASFGKEETIPTHKTYRRGIGGRSNRGRRKRTNSSQKATQRFPSRAGCQALSRVFVFQGFEAKLLQYLQDLGGVAHSLHHNCSISTNSNDQPYRLTTHEPATEQKTPQTPK